MHGQVVHNRNCMFLLHNSMAAVGYLIRVAKRCCIASLCAKATRYHVEQSLGFHNPSSPNCFVIDFDYKYAALLVVIDASNWPAFHSIATIVIEVRSRIVKRCFSTMNRQFLGCRCGTCRCRCRCHCRRVVAPTLHKHDNRIRNSCVAPWVRVSSPVQPCLLSVSTLGGSLLTLLLSSSSSSPSCINILITAIISRPNYQDHDTQL
jgi:hypothetical protein